jgi:hypothetical protein
VDPSTRSRERREAISDRDNPVSLLPVVGVPNGARTVNCFIFVGKAYTSATADGGFDARSKRKADDAATRPFTNQLRRLDWGVPLATGTLWTSSGPSYRRAARPLIERLGLVENAAQVATEKKRIANTSNFIASFLSRGGRAGGGGLIVVRDRRSARLPRKLIPFPRQAAPWHA